MDNSTLKQTLTEEYGLFFHKLHIDPQTGILGVIANESLKDQLGKIRFTGYPYIGSKYSSAKKKILIVGLDVGVDELKDNNTYHSFETRNHCIEPQTQSENNYNNHISGTYGTVMFLLKDYYGWNEIWEDYFSDNTRTFKTILDTYGPTVLPFDVLSYVSLTNIHKFVTVDREKRSGDENRRWYNPKEEKELFLHELQCFAPDIIYVQGKSKFDGILLEEMKNQGYKIVLSDHPSSWRNGANKPTYVKKGLHYINWD